MATKTANEQLRDSLIAHQIYLLRFSGYVRNRITAMLNATEGRIADLLRSRLAGSTGLATPSDFKRLERIRELIGNVRSNAWQDVYKTWADQLVELANAEPGSINQMVLAASPTVLQTVLPAASQLRAIALSQPFQGRVLRDWASTMESDDLARIMGAVQQGMVAGQSAAAITRLVVGSARLDGADGITEMTRRNVQSVVRTSVMHVSNAAREEFVSENSDLFTEELFVATLDSRTTAVCRANDGKRFPLGKGPMPPLHYQCRSLRVPVIGEGPVSERPAKPFTQRQLLDEFTSANGLASVSKRDQLPRGTKGQFDDYARRRARELTGRVPASTSYSTWMRDQSVAFQDEVLGKTKARLFRDGGLELDRFVNRNGDELTLSQLARLEADAFRRAGLNPGDY